MGIFIFIVENRASYSEARSFLKSGNYLSSRQFSASTFGVKELNFCVRNGNRWILFAIITAMVIYLCVLSTQYTYVFVVPLLFAKLLELFLLTKINNYIANFVTKVFSYLSLKLVKIIDFSLLKCKDFIVKSFSLISLRSSQTTY